MNYENAGERLIEAIQSDDTATVASIISSGVNLNDEPWPLHEAARRGRLKIMTLLLDAGANIDLPNDYHKSACYAAIFGLQLDALKLLVKRGANVDVQDGQKSLLVLALERPGDQYLCVLLDAGVSLKGRHSAEVLSFVRSVAVYKRLLTRGVNFAELRDWSCATLVHYIAHNVTEERDFRFLVDACGTDSAVNSVDHCGQTPFQWATDGRNSVAIRVLAELGANVDHQDSYGKSALHIAAAQTSVSIPHFKLLLALGADVHLVTNRGQTAFSLALRQTNTPFALLMAAGGGEVDLDQPNDDDETLSMIAERNEVEFPTANQVAGARRRIAKTRLDLVRHRATEICIGLHRLRLDALQLCEIMMHSFGANGALIAFHQWWAIATKVKHFTSK